MTNPLLENYELPPFSRIEASHVLPAVEQILAENRAAVDALLQRGGPFTWSGLVEPLDDLDDRLNKAWSPVGHLNAVMNSEALREAYNACLPLLSEYATEMGQNAALYAAFREIAEGGEYARLDTAQRKIVDNALRDFRLSGVALEGENKARFKEIAQELSQLGSRFSDNVLDATKGWTRHIEDEALLAGLPETDLAVARQAAEAEGKPGWVFGLAFPSYIAIMTHADDRALREEFYQAYATRASETGPQGGRWDNSEVMEKILALRHEEANLLGFSNYAELSLATKMAESPEQVLSFLNDLADKALPFARRDLEELRAFARNLHGIEELQSWDVAYYSEKLREHKYAFSEEEVKAYFPAERVVSGLFAVVQRLYGLEIKLRDGVDVWHPDVHYYEIFDRLGERRGGFYLDLYARPSKRSGAWMDECISRRRVGASIQIPVAYLTCNFTPPAGDEPALLRHDDVVTLFHEFGHGLHHLLTRVEYLGVSGIRGVEWDAVELPSQFMENFCWEREALALISGHHRTGEPLPDALLAKMLAAKNFQAGMQTVRQLEFALLDFRIHRDYDPARGGRVYETLDEVRRQVSVMSPPAYNRFPHSFQHIFGGGYAAGYYSYKWAEVLSSDAFSLFEERGIFDPETGHAFLANVLEQGGRRSALESFVAFRGREPEIEALLRHSGMLPTAG
ncbi:oligopeptidase A [Methylococcus geothermalis]|uniref:oligopeptidase A n=1 Tax=Methylococcus geothermalis TaxID=2681310 RepID=A0A858Q8U0_9GAMM|nr:oligopeptidase A [Methylococcus geothermalis]QJD30250.1 oligopeptidase A [Methylococcus geothermalis]